MSTLNDDGAVVTHFDAFGDGSPLCGWIGAGEEASGDWLGVDCRDCMVAMSGEEGGCGGCGRMIVMTGVPLAWRWSGWVGPVFAFEALLLALDAKRELEAAQVAELAELAGS